MVIAVEVAEGKEEKECGKILKIQLKLIGQCITLPPVDTLMKESKKKKHVTAVDAALEMSQTRPKTGAHFSHSPDI